MKQRGTWVRLIPALGILLLLLEQRAASEGARAGLALCVRVLIPSLFPVSVLANCLVKLLSPNAVQAGAGGVMRRLFGLPGIAAVPVLLGLVGGFPLGAQLTAGLYRQGRISKQDAICCTAICNNAGPGFLIGSVGCGIFNRPMLGLALLVIQLLSVLLTGILFRQEAPLDVKKAQADSEQCSLAAALPLAIGESANAMLTMTGAVVFFRAVTGCFGELLPLSALPQLRRAGLSGLFELAGGMALLTGAEPLPAFVLSSALIGWGGLCVHLQAAAALRAAGLPMQRYLAAKAVQAGIACILSATAAVMIQSGGTLLPGISLFFGLILTYFLIFKKRRWKSTRAVL